MSEPINTLSPVPTKVASSTVSSAKAVEPAASVSSSVHAPPEPNLRSTRYPVSSVALSVHDKSTSPGPLVVASTSLGSNGPVPGVTKFANPAAGSEDPEPDKTEASEVIKNKL